jgi:hypothetical protein
LSIASILEQHIQPGGELELPVGALGPYVQAMLVAYLPEATWNVASAQVNGASDGTATLTGTGLSAPFSGMTIEATFTPPDTAATGTITATAPSGWTLATAFPGLAPTFVGYLDYGVPQSLTLNCGATPSASGLVYQGSLELTDELIVLAALLYGGNSSVSLGGPVGVDLGAPVLALAAPPSEPLSLGGGIVELGGVTLMIESSVLPGSGEVGPTVTADLALATQLSFDAQGTTVPIGLRASYNPNGGALRLAAQADSLASAGLAELSKLLAGHSPDGVIPTGLELEDILTLTDVVVLIDPTVPEVAWLQAGVKSVKQWTLIEGTSGEPAISVDELALVFRYYLTGQAGLQATLFGEIAIGSTAKLDVTAMYPDFAVYGELRAGTSVSLTEIITHFLGPSPDVPALTVTEFAFDVAPPAYSGSIAIESDWAIPLASDKTLTVQEVGLALSHSGPGATTARLTGRVQVVGAEVDVNWQLPEAFQLSAAIPPVELSALIRDFSQQPLPDLPTITLSESSLYVEKQSNGGFYAAFGTTVDRFGLLEVDFYEIAGTTGFAAGLVLPNEWSLADLSSVFEPVDFLKFREASLIVASADDPNFTFRSFTEPKFNFPTVPPSAPAGVKKGVALYAELLLEGGPLSVIKQLFPSVSTLDIGLVFPANYADTTLTASFDGQLVVFPGTVVVDQFQLSVDPGQQTFIVALTVDFTIHGQSLRLLGEVVLIKDQVDLIVTTETPWVEPFGIRNLTIDAVGFELTLDEDGEVGVTLAGAVTIGSGTSAVQLQAAAEFNAEDEGIPDVFLAEELGTIALAQAVEGFLAVDLPTDLLDVELSNFQLIVVANPAGWVNPLDNRFYRAGLAFAGSLDFYGLVATFAIQVDYATGISAAGQMETPLTIGSAVVLSAADSVEKGPSFQISTTDPVHLRMDASLTLFELGPDLIEAEISNNSFYVHLRDQVQGLGWVELDVSVRSSGHLHVEAACKFSVARVGPIMTPLGFSLGSLNTDLSLDAYFVLDITPSGMGLSLRADFQFQGLSLRLGPIDLQVSLSSLAQVAGQYAQHLAQELWDVAKDVLQHAEALFDAVANGVISLTDDIGYILARELSVSLTKAAELLTRVADVMAYDTFTIASLLKEGFDAGAEDLVAALRAAGHDAEAVAEAIAKLFEDDEHWIAWLLRQAEYGLDEIARTMRQVWNTSAPEVARFFRESWGLAAETVENALHGAGYLLDQINDAMESVFDWVKDVVEDIGDALDPRNW